MHAQLAPVIASWQLLSLPPHAKMAAVAAPPLASPAHDPVGAALESSRKEFYRQLKDPKLKTEIDKITTVDQVYEATKRLQEDQGKSKTLRSLGKIRTFLERLDEYSKVLGIFVQVKPDVLALIWGPIKLLIHLSSNLVKSMDAIIDVMSLIGDKLPIFTDYAKLFKANPRVNHILALIFRDILNFYLAALNFFALRGESHHRAMTKSLSTNHDLPPCRLAYCIRSPVASPP